MAIQSFMLLTGLLAALAAPLSAGAQTVTPDPQGLFNDSDGSDDAPVDESAAGLRWSGYGQLNYERFDFYLNAQDTSPETRARTDLRRVVLEPSMTLRPGITFRAEIEFEHGGSGSAVEYEPEEAGEFEAEIERGGEVILENAYLEFTRSPALKWRVGEMTVPFGMANVYHRPTHHFTIERSLVEAVLIPVSWHDMGIAATGVIAANRYTVMLSRALDSSGFSGYGFVSGGAEQRLEHREANDLALTLRLDRLLRSGWLLGGALHVGDSSGNRPRANLDASARVTLLELHTRYERGPWTVRAQYIAGRIQNADLVTQANFNTFNAGELGVSRTPVGSRANGWFVEAGFNLFSLSSVRRDDRLDLFARVEQFDTHAATTGSIVRNTRYARRAVTLGMNYRPWRDVVFKGEFSRRENDGSTANTQNYLGLAVGFQF